MITIGTRGSELARAQSGQIARRLAAAGHASQLQILRTRGDVVVDRAFTQMAGKGFFTKEIEDALRAGSVDLAVHSLKDLPTEEALGLQVMAIPTREDPRDCLIVRPEAYEAAARPLPLRQGARVGTSAVRRVAQLRHLRGDLQVLDLRGNVPTRLRRLLEGRFEAIVLAQAGLNRLRLDLQGCVAVPLPPALFVPAPGQGALALQGRRDDGRIRGCVAALHADHDAACVALERAVLAHVEGGCHAPLGAYAYAAPGGLALQIFYEDRGGPRRHLVRGAAAPALLQAALDALGVAGRAAL